MKTMLVVILALAIFVTFCDAQCTFTKWEIIDGSPPSGCKDARGFFHEFQTQWKYGCLHCSCDSRVGLTCCDIVMKPRVYDTKNCKLIFSNDPCMYIPVNKANPSQKCEVSVYVG